MLLNRTYPVAAGLFAVFCWASLPVIMKLGLETLPLTFFLFLRFMVSSLFCLTIIRLDFSKIPELGWRRWGLLGVLLTALFSLQAIAIHEIPATWYIAIFSLSPLLSLLLVRARLSTASRWGVAVALLGTLFFAFSSGQFQSISFKGLVALLGGMVAWALYVPSIQPFQKVFNDRQVTAITNFLSLIPVALIWLAQGAPMAPFSPMSYLAITVLGFLVPLAYWAFLYAIREVPVFGITSQYLEPVIGFGLATLVLNESLTLLQVAGGGLIVAGVALIQAK